MGRDKPRVVRSYRVFELPIWREKALTAFKRLNSNPFIDISLYFSNKEKKR